MELMLFAFWFPNLPDLLHFDYIRVVSHSILGCIALVVPISLFFKHLKLLQTKEAVLVSIMALSHLFFDYFFSTVQFYWPFNNLIYSIYGFNTTEDILFEGILGFLFMMSFLFYLRKVQNHLFKTTDAIKDKGNTNYFVLILQIGFTFFSTLQLGMFVFLNFVNLMNLELLELFTFIMFIFFIVTQIYVSIYFYKGVQAINNIS
jgi:hypothetical protein